MNKRLIGLLVATIILLGSVALLQWHGIKFWQEKVGSHGWAWSLLLEFIALWLWYQRSISFRALALVASLLTLSGPIYQVAKPTFVQSYDVVSQHESNKTRLASLMDEKARLTEQLGVYQENSIKRTGWLGAITTANDRITEIDNEITEIKLSNDNKVSWFFDWVILMEIASLLLFQVVAVLSITTISKKVNDMEVADGEVFPNDETKETHRRKGAESGGFAESLMENSMEKWRERQVENQNTTPGKPLLVGGQEISIEENAPQEKPQEEPQPESAGESTEETFEPLIILNELNEYMKNEGLNFSKFSALSGVSSKELSFLRNHSKRLETGERTVSIPALEKISRVIKSAS